MFVKILKPNLRMFWLNPILYFVVYQTGFKIKALDFMVISPLHYFRAMIWRKYVKITIILVKLLKDLFNNVSDFEKSGLSLSVPLQKYIIPDLDMKLDELFEFFE